METTEPGATAAPSPNQSMTIVEKRFRSSFPTIHMTMISLIVALLYENLVSGMRDLEGLWEGDAESFFLWAQCFVLTINPLLFWFTQTLNSAALRAVFVPRLALVPVLVAAALFFFVSNLGLEHASAWLYGWGVLTSLAWVAFRDFGSLYESDGDTPGGLTSHKRSGAVMVATGLVVLCGAVLSQLGQVEAAGAGVFLLVCLVGAVGAHYLWYAEWKIAVGMLGKNA